MNMNGVDTKWRKRTRKLRSKYLGNNGDVDQDMTVKKGVKAAEKEIWEAGMQTKLARGLIENIRWRLLRKESMTILKENS